MNVDSRNFLYHEIVVGVAFLVIFTLFVMPAVASDRYVNNGDGTVTDTKTGLMWAARDNGIPISWPDGLSYCQNYSGGNYSDWRMPTLPELASLYNPECKNKRGYHVTRLIQTSAQSLWASETRGFEAARFNFTYGQVYWLRRTYHGPTRVLPVRSSK
jgi:hypothetical protein